MKIFKLFNLAIIASSILLFASCGDDKNDEPIVTPPVVTPDPELVVGVIGNGSISNAAPYEITKDTVFPKGTYTLTGWVYVTKGAKITFKPGTIIKGVKDKKSSLIIEPGSKIIAQGTAAEPIIFTSSQPKGQRKPGDWGGLIICGNAKTNYGTGTTQLQIEGGPRTMYGGSNDNDNSGILSYVRIEFAGIPLDDQVANKEINGVTFGGVGQGTQVDHVQVSYSGDDSFEWFGGTVNAKYLVAYHGWDDDFDTDYGFSGKLQFLLAARHPRIADQSLSNGFESDNNGDGTNTTPKTSAVFSNVTLVGPIGQDNAFTNTLDFINGGGLMPNNGSQLGRFQAAMQIRRYSQMSCFNSVAMGFPVGLLLDNNKGNTQSLAGNALKINNVLFAQMNVVGSDINGNFMDKLSTDGTNAGTAQSFSHTFFAAQTGNQALANITDLKLRQPNSMIASPNWGPISGSPLTGKQNLFADTMVSTWFDKVDYIGAFKSDADADNWTKGWTNFDPQNTDY